MPARRWKPGSFQGLFSGSFKGLFLSSAWWVVESVESGLDGSSRAKKWLQTTVAGSINIIRPLPLRDSKSKSKSKSNTCKEKRAGTANAVDLHLLLRGLVLIGRRMQIWQKC